ncbi:uncharacterized protein LTR77_003188 [Saxophila tyrrhenica]|uniref:CoA-transferase family III n=1 Tax=Saxophila tyrrhenica TaxID=1690608 RepID=A0AAV9PH81_9PEZI|nr:hypothetical protein LTR77_003188 [Saxophila tyrrhenica]
MSTAPSSDVVVNGGPIPDRPTYTPWDTVRYIWTTLGLPLNALDSLTLENGGPYYKSSFQISHTAQSSIALSALSAALIHSLQTGLTVPQVTVPLRHACLEFQTEKLFTINGQPLPSTWGPIGGLHKCADGYVRIHDSFSNHRNGTLKLLDLDEGSSRDDVAEQVAKWKKLELEEAGHSNRLAIYALHNFAEWNATPQAEAISNFPIIIRKIGDDGPNGLPSTLKNPADRCLRGLRVLELSRVIAGPVCGKTLALHGADVMWITSPHLPDLPSLDRNLSRGKRSIQLDLDNPSDRKTLKELIKTCNVFIQGYRPSSLAARGFGPADLAALNPGIIYANLSAFGPEGPWSNRRGFDSLVQTCSGMNVSEAEHSGSRAPAQPTPVQALDHAGGFLLAAGIMAALYKKSEHGGSWEVHVSLAGVMKYLRSLGQWPGKEGFEHRDPASDGEELPEQYFEERESAFGHMRGLKHAAQVEGAQPGFDFMSRPLGRDDSKWL